MKRAFSAINAVMLVVILALDAAYMTVGGSPEGGYQLYVCAYRTA